MNRRSVLHLVGSGAVTGLAGCASSVGSDSSNATSPSSATPGPEAACPPMSARQQQGDFEDGFEPTVVCYQRVDDPASKTVLKPSGATLSLPDGTLSFTLMNRREEQLNTVLYRWELWKYVNSEWFPVASSRVHSGSRITLAPGKSHTWHLSVDNTNLKRPVEPPESNEDLTVRAVGSGTYAFLTSGAYGEDGQNGLADDPISYAAQFTVEGDKLELKPTNTVSNVEKDGDTVIVTVGQDSRSSYTFTRVSDPKEEPTTLIMEQLYGKPVFRNAMAHVEDGVETVEVKTDQMPSGPTGYVEYDGTVYKLKPSR